MIPNLRVAALETERRWFSKVSINLAPNITRYNKIVKSRVIVVAGGVPKPIIAQLLYKQLPLRS